MCGHVAQGICGQLAGGRRDARTVVGMDLSEVLRRGIFRRSDLVAAGMSARTIDRRIAAGLLVPVGPGLLAVPVALGDPRAADRIAGLRLGDGGALAGPSAAQFFPPGPVSELVTSRRPWVFSTRHVRLDAEILHHPHRELVRREGLRVASPRQSVLDCFRVLPLSRARDLAFRAIQQRTLSPPDLLKESQVLSRYRGARQLRTLLDAVGTGAHARSEEIFHRKLRAAGLDEWVANLWVLTDLGEICIDIAFTEARLAIEFDSERHHASSARFRKDRRKWNRLKVMGWEVLNYTWWAVMEDRDNTLAEIRHFLP